jgi:hypothetical protein
MNSGAMFHGKGRGYWLRLFVLILGILTPQVTMLWSSLTGSTVVLPVDGLVWSIPDMYPELSALEREKIGPPRWPNSIDAIFQTEPFRRFAVEELHAGRLPVWNPNNYAGVPFIGEGQSAVFSPYRLIEFLSRDPMVLAWAQLARALVAGLGMYFFLRWGLGLTWHASAAGAWIYPLTGFMMVWNGWPMGVGATWMGWILLATELTVRRGGIKWPAALGVFTCFLIFAGHPQIVAHVLLLSGVYALWRVGIRYWGKADAWAGVGRMGACVGGWVLGLCLGAVQLVPLVSLTLESSRFKARAEGLLERPAQGGWALMQMIQPWICGEESPTTMYLLTTNRNESGAAGYSGLLVLFVLAPLAWRLKRWRGQAYFWACVGVLGMSAVAGIPLLEKLVGAWPLGMFSSNRMTCMTAFAVAVLAGVGVNAMTRQGRASAALSRVWMVWPALTLGLVFFLSVQMGNLREKLIPGLSWLVKVASPEQVEAEFLRLEAWFQWQYFVAMGLLVVSAVMFAALAREGMGFERRRMLAMVVVVLGVCEMTCMTYSGITQADRRYYPDKPELIQRLKELGQGRVLGVDVFEPNMNLWWGVESPAGYDALDPVGITSLMRSATDEPIKQTWAQLMVFEPSGRWGVLRALNVRFLATWKPREGLGAQVLSANGLNVYEVAGVMPRAYVPRRVRSVDEPKKVLELMNDGGFDPAEIGFVTGSGKVEFDAVAGSASARMIEPGRTEVTVEMATPGMVVLADAYARGWEARYNGAPVEILKANYAIRGVVVPAGKGVVEFVYKPRDLRWGFFITCGAVAVLIGLGVWGWRSGVD